LDPAKRPDRPESRWAISPPRKMALDLAWPVTGLQKVVPYAERIYTEPAGMGALLMMEADRYPSTDCSAGIRMAAAQSRTLLYRAIGVPKWNSCVCYDLLPCATRGSLEIEISGGAISVFWENHGRCATHARPDPLRCDSCATSPGYSPRARPGGATADCEIPLIDRPTGLSYNPSQAIEATANCSLFRLSNLERLCSPQARRGVRAGRLRIADPSGGAFARK